MYAAGQGFDTISDFTRGSGNDILDLKDVFTGHTVTSGNLSQFVNMRQSSGSTIVAVDSNGTTGGQMLDLALLQNVAFTATLLDDMLAQGNLVVS